MRLNLSEMGFISFLGEMISMLLDKGPLDDTEITHSKFVSSVVDTLKSSNASTEDILQALRDLGAVVYIGMFISYADIAAELTKKCVKPSVTFVINALWLIRAIYPNYL